ncbi:MAG TPA: glycine zipper family protein [Methylophilaceae bacterium]|nr:glycine zipper family protein [Methylophilaceae bacterium]
MKTLALVISGALIISGCTTIPDGPSRMALPGTGKSFDQFRYDDSSCQQYGLEQSGISASKAGNDSMAKSAAVGTAVGAVLGAAVGGRDGAAIGAGTGLLVGTAAGSDAAAVSSYTAQQRYDNAYTQCMYAKGHKVPVSGNLVTQARPVAPVAPPVKYAPPAPRVYYPPPPPPGYVR